MKECKICGQAYYGDDSKNPFPHTCSVCTEAKLSHTHAERLADALEGASTQMTGAMRAYCIENEIYKLSIKHINQALEKWRERG